MFYILCFIVGVGIGTIYSESLYMIYIDVKNRMKR